MKKNKLKNGLVCKKCCIASSSFYIIDFPFVIYDGSIYKMWYGGYDSKWKLYYATSKDGVSWEKHGVVVDVGGHGESDSEIISTPLVIYNNNTYQMWYSGYDGKHYRIHYVTSKDGINWTKHGVVVDLGDKDDSDDHHTLVPFVIYDGSTYKMWYNGYDGSHYRIHYATSEDGLNWTKHGVVIPLGDEGESDNFYTYYPSVIYDDTKYHMWYIGHNCSRTKILYATSNDGLNWTKSDISTSPLHNFYNNIHQLDTPCIIKYRNLYKIWFNGCVDGKWGLYYTEISKSILK